ncbi:MAG TPA: BamA/TamA family outer membrane protein [Steroidobacteraceae bacterium]|jgi:translocation and assembly module TamA
MRLKHLIPVTALLLAPWVRGADPQSYTLHIQGPGYGALDAALKASSQLQSLRTSAPAGPFALIGRAEGDVERLRTVLESFGYYHSQVSITILGRALDDVGLRAALEALPAGKDAPVQIGVQTGPLYHLRRITIEGDISAKARSAFALQSGAPAIAADVLAAGQRLLEAVEEEGHAYAKLDEPVAYQDASEPALDVSFTITPGPVYRVGEIHFEGMTRMHEKYLRRRLKLHSGELYRPSQIERARTDLLGLGAFAGLSVRLPKQEEVQGDSVPITFLVKDRKRHAVTVNAAYSSDLGGSGGVTWTDRNVFGNAEQLNLGATITDWGGSDTTGRGYNLTSALTKPDFGRLDQSLQLSLSALKQPLIAYDQTAQIGAVTLSRKLSAEWTVGVGVSLEQEKILQEGSNFYYSLFALPITAKYDSTGLSNPLLDPLHGVRLALSVAPTESIGHPDATFVIFQATTSTYLDLARFGWNDPGRSVFAVRGLFAQAHGASTFGLPPDQRFYAGGSATIRGYAYQSVGPVFTTPVPLKGGAVSNPQCTPSTPTGPEPTAPGSSQPIPCGGADLLAGGIEFRQRFGEHFGGALFLDAGKVTNEARPFEGRASIGYGAGIRYYTPIGPIRLDLAAPVHRLQGGDVIEVYIGLGQAF